MNLGAAGLVSGLPSLCMGCFLGPNFLCLLDWLFLGQHLLVLRLLEGTAHRPGACSLAKPSVFTPVVDSASLCFPGMFMWQRCGRSVLQVFTERSWDTWPSGHGGTWQSISWLKCLESLLSRSDQSHASDV